MIYRVPILRAPSRHVAANATSSSPPRWLRRCALGMGSVFVWTMILSAPIDALAHQPRKAPLPTYHPPVLPKPVDDPAWHTIDYYHPKQANAPTAVSLAVPPASSAGLTLLDEVGRLASPIAAIKVAEWKNSLHHPRALSAADAAKLHVWLGEYALAQEEQPDQALWHFSQAQKLSSHKDTVYGLAVYDSAVVAYYEGAYGQAQSAFAHVLTAKPGLRGFDRSTATLFMRHARACAGYHAERAALGIPEPPKLDPLCGAAAVAQALKTQGKPYDKKHILANMRVTGRGSSLQDVVDGAQKLGLSAHVVHVGDEGLIALPKPLVAYVEHDHFVSVIDANKEGVSYLCADCGPWPGGRVNLTWQQWHRMEATRYAVLTKPGSDVDDALNALLAPDGKGKQGIQVASLSGKLANGIAARLNWMRLLRKQITSSTGAGPVYCGFTMAGQNCASCQSDCPTDGSGGGSGTGSGGSGGGGATGGGSGNPSGPVGGGGGNSGGGSGISEGIVVGPMMGDPVNLATGAEEYNPSPDLTVYNPLGPSVTWSRSYNSLRGHDVSTDYHDFGSLWSTNYDTGVFDPSPGAGGATKYVIEPNGARFAIHPPVDPNTHQPLVPSSSQPRLACTMDNGAPLLVEWDYNSASGGKYYTITYADRTRYITADAATNGPGSMWAPVGQIVDNNGNAIKFNYLPGPFNQYTHFPGNALLTSIVDKNNQALLTINRATNNNVTSVQDRYGRSVYYNVSTYSNRQELDHVSQVVVAGAAGPPDRFVYGYQNIANGENSETVPLLHTITVPSPTGTGTQTATINYLPTYCTVLSLVDANGNSRNYSQPDASHTQVTVKDPQGNIVYRYTAGYDMNMSVTTVTNGVTDANGHNTQIIAANTYADPNNPYRPSEGQNGNGYAANGVNGMGTTNKTWDKYGNCTSMTSARGTTTTYAYNYTNFALGELTGMQEGAKTPTAFTYFEPSGLIQTMQRAAPGTSGQANQTVTYSYTYDALGNMLTASGPGNNATQTETVTIGYTQDGSYSQAEAYNQPLTKTDSLGHVKHYRYDALGRTVARMDALGNETDTAYNLVGQGTSVTFPATGETGTGRAQVVNTFLYPGGPQTALTQYNEAGTQVYQEAMTYGPEGESLTRIGSTQPVAQTYDALYRLKTVTDGNSHATTYSYNQNGYVSLIQYPNGDTMQLPSYDTNGSPLQRIDGRGVVVNFVYNDPESRLTDVQYPATPAINVHLAYDGYGRKSGITDGNGSQTVSYDDLSNLKSATTSYTGVAAQTLNYGYNPDGSRSSLTASYGGYSYTYDAAGRATGLSNPGGHSWSWAYANNDWLTGQMADNTVVTTPNRDSRGFILDLNNKRTDMAHTLLSDYAITYSPNLTLGSIASTVPAASAFSGTTSYQHDSKVQLTSEQSNRGGSYNNSFGYDSAGNPTTFKGASNAFNNANQNTAYGYDGNGNPTSYKGNALTFDAENRLTAYGSILSAGYRADGQRAWKQTANGKVFYIYDGDKLLYETNAAGAVTAQNTWGVGGLLARQNSGRTLLYVWDAQGNVSQQIDAGSGSIVASYMFDAFGTRGVSTTDVTAASDPYSGFGGSQGYYADSETGLLLLGHRYYDPATGRFLTRDPISYSGGMNLYAYGSNSPLSGYDPSGASFGGEFLKCLGQAEHAFECIAALTKMIAIGMADGIDCIPEAMCQTALACLVDGFFQCACEAIVLVVFPEAGELASGCACGGITSGLHYALDLVCNKVAGCEKKKFDLRCLGFNVGMGILGGCIGGLASELGADIGGDTLIQRLIMALMNGMFDGASDMACGVNHWQ